MRKVIVGTAALAAAAAFAAPALAWSNTGPAWTKQQAYVALKTTPELQAVTAYADEPFRFVVKPRQVTWLRGVGPAVFSGGSAHWRRFEVVMTVDPVAGEFPLSAPRYPFVSFCLHVNGPVRTAHPFSVYRLSGFEAQFGRLKGGGPTWGCGERAIMKRSVGIPSV